MHGNVWEWCEDDWHSNYTNAPTDGSVWIESDRKNARKLLRGGSWDDDPVDCRSAIRVISSRDNRDDGVGFRVSCVVG
jgi:formylglycine-generating enzyme required for sulfatase activity